MDESSKVLTGFSGNLFGCIPDDLDHEIFQEIVGHRSVTIERIISRGHTSPESGWHDQERNEWVLVLQGAGTVSFEDGHDVMLLPGDQLFIPAHSKHRVTWTDPAKVTLWLAVHFANVDQ